jgi:hypothetical protein
MLAKEAAHKMRAKFAILVLFVFLSLTFVFARTASAEGEMCPCGSGREFGQHHAQMAQNGMLGKDMHPGMHQGFSACLP